MVPWGAGAEPGLLAATNLEANAQTDFILTHKIFMPTASLCSELLKQYQCRSAQGQTGRGQINSLDDEYLVAKKRRVIKFVRFWMLMTREHFFQQQQIQPFLNVSTVSRECEWGSEWGVGAGSEWPQLQVQLEFELELPGRKSSSERHNFGRQVWPEFALEWDWLEPKFELEFESDPSRAETETESEAETEPWAINQASGRRQFGLGE